MAAVEPLRRAGDFRHCVLVYQHAHTADRFPVAHCNPRFFFSHFRQVP